MDQLKFEAVAAVLVTAFGTEELTIQRAKVPGGWLVLYDEGKSITFYPDPAHAWTGSSVE
jgi:hypothetical protein